MSSHRLALCLKEGSCPLQLALSTGPMAVELTSRLMRACLSVSRGKQSCGYWHGIFLPPYYKTVKMILHIIYFTVTDNRAFFYATELLFSYHAISSLT